MPDRPLEVIATSSAWTQGSSSATRLVLAGVISVGSAFMMVLLYTAAIHLGLEGAALLFAPLLVLFLTVLLLVASFGTLGTGKEVKLTLGDDGLSVGEASGFISYADVSKVRSRGEKLSLRLRDGRTLNLRVRLKSEVGAEAAYRRIVEGQQATELADHEETRLLLARGGRSTADWIAALRVLANHETYREAALGPERLWSIVQNGAIEPAHRAAAAIGLLPTLDANEKERLRVAAEASISPKVRIALESIAQTAQAEEAADRDLEDHALTQILERLED